MIETDRVRHIALAILVGLACMGVVPDALAKEQEPPKVTFDGLELVPDSQVAYLYVRSEADFGVFNKVMIDEAEVAFRRGWERDQRRSVQRITSRDIEQIKQRTADLLREVFVETLEADDGYQVVEKPGDDVLLVRPMIVDLDVTSPDTGRTARSSSFVSNAGAATLLLELYDSVTGEILGRAIDRQGARDFGTFQHSSRVRNSAEAQRIFRGWAKLLRAGLDEVHGGGGE